MKNIIKQYIYQLKNNSFLKHTTISYTVIGSVLLVLFTFISACIITSSALEELNASNIQTLSQSCNAGDLLLRDLQSLVIKNLESNSILSDAIYEKPSADAETAKKINNEIKKARCFIKRNRFGLYRKPRI